MDLLHSPPQPRAKLWLFAAIALLYIAFPNPRPDFSEFNSHDSESYLALSINMLERQQYTRNLSGEYVAHRLWPPGMPLLLMPAVVFSGDTINWYYVKYTVIAIALFGLYLTWRYVYLLTGRQRVADVTLAFLALNPYYWHFSRLALTEMVTFVWVILSLLLIHRAWHRRQTTFTQLALTGFICGLGMMVKGMAIGLAFVPLAYCLANLRQPQALKLDMAKFAVFFVSFFIVFIAWSYRNSFIDVTNLGLDGVNQIQMLFKTVVEDPTSRFRTLPEFIATAKENVLWHGIYHYVNQTIPLVWLADLKNAPFGNVLALLGVVCVFVLTNPLRQRSWPAGIVLGPIMVMLCLMVIGGAERYWVIISFMMYICMAVNYSALSTSASSTKRISRLLSPVVKIVGNKGVIGVLLVAQSVSLVSYIYQFEKAPYNPRDHYAEFAELLTSLNGYCVTGDGPELVIRSRNNHAVELITGCAAPMNSKALATAPEYNSAIVDVADMPDRAYRVVAQNARFALIEYTDGVN